MVDLELLYELVLSGNCRSIEDRLGTFSLSPVVGLTSVERMFRSFSIRRELISIFESKISVSV